MREKNFSGLTCVLWRLLILASIVCSSILPVFAQGQRNEVTEEMQKAVLRQQVLGQIAVDKAKFVEGLVGRWITLTNDDGTELRNALMNVSDDRLVEASSADSMAALDKILFGTDDLGSLSGDLVFNKVTPCRIIDTRIAGGILTAGVPRNFDANGPFSGQGGSSTNCGLPSADPAALVVIMVAVNPAGNGNLRAYPKDAAPPTAVVINYSAGLNLANTVIVPLKQSAGDALEFTVSANVSNSHLVADVVGYFWAPSATPLNCTTLTASTDVNSGANWFVSTAVCPSGRTLTGGGVSWTPIPNGFCTQKDVWLYASIPTAAGTAWNTQGRNECGDVITVTSYARCCQIPGL